MVDYGSARDTCISRGALGVGACRDPSAAIEVSLGKPPKMGGSEVESGCGFPPGGVQK